MVCHMFVLPVVLCDSSFAAQAAIGCLRTAVASTSSALSPALKL